MVNYRNQELHFLVLAKYIYYKREKKKVEKCVVAIVANAFEMASTTGIKRKNIRCYK